VPVEVQIIQQAYRFALDPTPRQERMLRSHAGAARFAYNWGNARIIAALDAREAEKAAGGEAETKTPGHFDLCKEWTAWKDAHLGDPEPEPGERRTNTAWVAGNFVGSYQAALRDAAKAWSDFFESAKGNRKGRRLGRPRFKKKGKARDSFQVHGNTLRVESAGIGFRPKGSDKGATRDMVVLPKIGPVFLAESGRKLRRWTRKGDVACPECRQAGVAPAPAGSQKGRDCPACGGANAVCEMCDGSGRLRACPACGGKLTVPACRIVRGTVARESDGRWLVSLTVELAREVRAVRVRRRKPGGKIVREWDPAPSARQRKGGVIGVDFGVRELATLSDGTVIPNPRHLEPALGRLARAQRAVARCEPGSNARRRAVARVGRLHARVRHLRLDSLHKATSGLIHSHERIVVEGFDVQETARYRRRGKRDPGKQADVPGKVRQDRNRALADTGIGMARWQLESKSAWYGCQVVRTDKHAPTGRTCSECGTVKTKPVPPADELFTCEACGQRMPRRLNTARVLAAVTVAPSTGETLNAPGGAVSPGAVRGTGRAPVKGEASTRPRPG
jgi:putative transposase